MERYHRRHRSTDHSGMQATRSKQLDKDTKQNYSYRGAFDDEEAPRNGLRGQARPSSPPLPPPPPPPKPLPDYQKNSQASQSARGQGHSSKVKDMRPLKVPKDPMISPVLVVSPPPDEDTGPTAAPRQFPRMDSVSPPTTPKLLRHKRSRSLAETKPDGAPLLRSVSAGSSVRKRKISSPYDPVHLTHVRHDPSTGQYTGVPESWKRYLQKEGIPRDEQKKNLHAIAQIIEFYARRPSLQPELPTVPAEFEKGGHLATEIPSTSSPNGPSSRATAAQSGVPAFEDEQSDLSALSATQPDPYITLYQYSVSPTRVEIIEKVGGGGFGDVHRARLKPGVDNNRTYDAQGDVAVKTLRFGYNVSPRRAKKVHARRSGLGWPQASQYSSLHRVLL